MTCVLLQCPGSSRHFRSVWSMDYSSFALALPMQEFFPLTDDRVDDRFAWRNFSLSRLLYRQKSTVDVLIISHPHGRPKQVASVWLLQLPSIVSWDKYLICVMQFDLERGMVVGVQEGLQASKGSRKCCFMCKAFLSNKIIVLWVWVLKKIRSSVNREDFLKLKLNLLHSVRDYFVRESTLTSCLSFGKLTTIFFSHYFFLFSLSLRCHLASWLDDIAWCRWCTTLPRAQAPVAPP